MRGNGGSARPHSRPAAGLAWLLPRTGWRGPRAVLRDIVAGLVHRGWHAVQSAALITGQTAAGRRFARFGGGSSVIGRGSHIVAHQSVKIGDDVFTGPYVYITDQNHGYEDPQVPIGRQWPRNQTFSIGAGTWLGAGAIILPGTRIGRNVVVAAGSVVRGDVPDRCVVAGVPARVVREYIPGTGWTPPLRPSRV